ncbi:UvrD-helicase domain-containing protein, partial [Prevotella sp.]|uniref:UvrD-helicase domain-containing protein n=1 Tax=Prevotella sp. TaxID=59823 RepID=UPI0027E3071A
MELLVYKASAGSGKTFTLAVEYIKLLMLNPRAYRQILAVTFTNKATAEMKERILTQLYGIWKEDPASDAYLKRIKEDLAKKPETASLSDRELRQRAGMALQYMLHDYSRFRVETIDSFFQSVMRNLARELELSPNLNIELNNAEVLSDAVDSMIEKLTPSSPVLAWLLDYINERIADDKRWNVSNEVKSFGRNIFDESYIERGEGLRFKLRSPETIKLYRDVLREMETDALEQMKGFYDQFEGELEGHALVPEDLKGGARGIGSYFRKLRDGRLADKDVLNATLQNCLVDAKNWATKTSSRKDEIIRLAETSLIPLLQDAERFRPQKNRTINSCRLSLQHLNKLQLLNHIDEEVRTLNREHNRFLLSDTNALLHKLVHEGDSSFVFEKIGANIRNVMIDEFQDTSRMQWDNFRMLLLEGLSQGADSLIVGDVKQSIYRWRNGDWGILNSLGSDQSKVPLCDAKVPLYDAEVPLYDAKPLHCESGVQLPFPFPVRVETLKTNRRSETNVIHFNNRLFTAAVDYLNALHLEELKEHALIQEKSEKGKPHITFVHSKMRLYIYEKLSPSRRRILHNKVAEALELRLKTDMDMPSLKAILFHYQRARNREKCLCYEIWNIEAYSGLNYELYPVLDATGGETATPSSNVLHYFEHIENDLLEYHRLNPDFAQFHEFFARLMHAKSRYCILTGNYTEGKKCLDSGLSDPYTKQNAAFLLRFMRQSAYYALQLHDTELLDRCTKDGLMISQRTQNRL